MDPFKVLGDFEIAIIVENFNREDIIRLQLVNHNWREILNSNFISKVAFLHHFSWCREVAEYHRLVKEANEQALERENDEVEPAPRYDFTAAFRKALRQRMSLRNATPQRVRGFCVPMYTWDGADTPTSETIWAVPDSNEPGYIACVTARGVLKIVDPKRDSKIIRTSIPVPVFSDRIYMESGHRIGTRRIEAKALKIMAGIIVLRGNGNITGRVSGNHGVTAVFLGFSAETGVVLWEHLVPYHILNHHTLDPIMTGHFDLVNRDGNPALVYIVRHGDCDKNGGVSIHWVDLHTGTKISEAFLDLGPLSPQGHGPFSPLDWLWRDIKFSKDGRYLATAALKEETASRVETRARWEINVLVPRGAHHNWGYDLFLGRIKGRVYRVYVHDMKTGKLVMNHELERPDEPNSGNIKAEFSPKIDFSPTSEIISLVEETYAYLTHEPSTEKVTIESYGWTIDLRRKMVAADEHIRRTLYTSQLSENECGSAGSYNPYRVETFIPSDNVSVIRYSTQGRKTRFDVGSYLAGADEIGQDGVEQDTSLMWDRKTVFLHPTENSVWETPAMMILFSSGSWRDGLVINERYIGISPSNPVKSDLTILDFGSN